MSSHLPGVRVLPVPLIGDGMRLDRFLAARFLDVSRTTFRKAIAAGEVTTADGTPLRASARVRAGDVLHLTMEGIAPDSAPPPLPAVLHEDDEVLVLDKPAGLLAHPAGTKFTWSAIGLAKEAWPNDRIDLVHRLDRDTSGTLILTKSLEANRFLKDLLVRGRAEKTYLALVKGTPDWTQTELRGAIGPADGPIRIQMAVRDDGQPAHTSAECLGSKALPDGRTISLIRCRLHTGRTHQIRVHLAHAGHGLVGDRLYGVPHKVFLDSYEHGPTPETFALAGAPRHALHAHKLRVQHPSGGELTVESPLAADLAAWWDDPSVLPWAP